MHTRSRLVTRKSTTPLRPRWLCIAAGLAALATERVPLLAADAPIVAAGFCIDSLVDLPTQGLAWGPGGAWGLDLYAASGSAIVRIAPDGSITTLTNGLDAPSGIAFSPAGGAFGDYLYVLQDGVATDNIVRIDSSGTVFPFAPVPPTVSVDLIDLVFSPGVGGYPAELYVTDLGGCGCTPGRVLRFSSAGAATPVLTDNATSPAGATFSSGGPFGAATFVFGEVANGASDDGAFRTVSPSNSAAVLASTAGTILFNPVSVVQGAGGPFGTDLYLGDLGNFISLPNTAFYLRRDRTGTLTTFITGLDADGYRATRAELRPDGLVLAVNSTTTVYLVREAPLADLDGNGTVDGADLGLLLAEWGAVESIGDLNCDGVVDGADLGSLLAQWG